MVVKCFAPLTCSVGKRIAPLHNLIVSILMYWMVVKCVAPLTYSVGKGVASLQSLIVSILLN